MKDITNLFFTGSEGSLSLNHFIYEASKTKPVWGKCVLLIVYHLWSWKENGNFLKAFFPAGASDSNLNLLWRTFGWLSVIISISDKETQHTLHQIRHTNCPNVHIDADDYVLISPDTRPWVQQAKFKDIKQNQSN